MNNSQEKEIIFMDILAELVIQFAECSDLEAKDFVIVFLKKLNDRGIRIKIK